MMSLDECKKSVEGKEILSVSVILSSWKDLMRQVSSELVEKVGKARSILGGGNVYKAECLSPGTIRERSVAQ